MQTPKTVLLTGASSGMGKVIAQTLARRGDHVFAAIRDVAGRNAANAEALRGYGGAHPITPVEIDVTLDESVERGVAQVIEAAGRVDVLINCAGVMWTGTTEAFSVDQFSRTIETNLIGPFRMYKAVLPSMRAQRSGLMITVTSTCGRLVPPGLGLYSATKFGLEALTEGLAYEVDGLGIDTVIIEPGPFATSLMDNKQAPARLDIVAEYGASGQLDSTLSQRMWPQLKASGVSTDPQIVADLVAELFDMPPGTRPLRKTVGMDSGVAGLNRAMGEFQRDFVEALGFNEYSKFFSPAA